MNTKARKQFIEWGVIAAVIVFLYTTGLHTEVIGGIQRVVLATGIITPEIPEETALAVADTGLQSGRYAYDVDLTSENGNTINLSRFAGKTVFVNIWATWCPPCVAEMPGIQKLYEKADTSRVAFVMLSVDDDSGKAIKFKARKEYTFPIYFLKDGLPPDFASRAIPTTFILGPDGKIVARHDGMANYNTDEFLDFLLATSKPVNATP